MRKVICAYCAKQFETENYRKITCSEDCGYFRRLDHNKKMYRARLERDRACKICRKYFCATDSRRVLCSQECADINRNNHFLAHAAKKKARAKKQDIKQCKYCSAQIADNSRKKYCNAHCAYLARLTPSTALLAEQGKIEEQRQCKRCNAPFVWTGRRNQKTHCSDECAYETKKQLHKEYAAKKAAKRTPEEHAAFLAHRRKWAERYRARNSGLTNITY